jgi:hypothetical protein
VVGRKRRVLTDTGGQLRDALAGQGVATSTSSLSRFLARHRITRKKGALHPAEQDRPDVAVARQA